MASVFGTPAFPFQNHAGSFRAEDLTLTIAGQSGAGSLVQQVNFTLNRNINMVYEIGGSNVYYVGNRRQGQAQLNRIVGGSANFRTLITTYGNMCSPADLSLSAGASNCGNNAQTVTYTLKKATLTSLGGSVTAQDIVFTESLGFMFLDIDY